jgi:hypothetical protein
MLVGLYEEAFRRAEYMRSFGKLRMTGLWIRCEG